MAKGIIVVDVPERCRDCKFCHLFRDMVTGEIMRECEIIGRLAIKNENEKPDWCPIRPLPERKDYKGPDAVNGTLMSTRAKQAIDEAGKMGWNNCIDEILKEEKKWEIFIFQNLF